MNTHYCINCWHQMEPQDRVENFETGKGSSYHCPKCYSGDLALIKHLKKGASLRLKEIMKEKNSVKI